MKAPKMEGTVRLLLITMVATATAATGYEYNWEKVKTINAKLSKLNNIQGKLHNTDVEVEWEAAKNFITDVHFEVNPHLGFSGPDCGGGPALTVGDGPMFCLHAMMFFRKTNTLSGIVNEIKGLQLGFVFQNSRDSSKHGTLVVDVFEKPEHEAGDLSGVVDVEPITTEQLGSLRRMKSFRGSVSWLLNIFERGIYDTKLRKTRNLEKKSFALTAYPMVMDAKTLKEVLQLPSVLQSSGSQSLNLLNLDKLQVKFHNRIASVEWEISTDHQADLYLQANPHLGYSGSNCGGGPSLTIDARPMFCLYGMAFRRQSDTGSGTKLLQIDLLFQNSIDSSNQATLLLDVIEKPSDEVADLFNIIEVEPITKLHLSVLRRAKSFRASAAWLVNVIERGIYGTELQQGGNLELRSLPVVMDEKTLKKILELSSEL